MFFCGDQPTANANSQQLKANSQQLLIWAEVGYYTIQ
jgi:hypothetical protein